MVLPFLVLTVKVEEKWSSGVGLWGERMVRPRLSGGPNSGVRPLPLPLPTQPAEAGTGRSWKEGTLSSMEAMIEFRSGVRVIIRVVLERGLSGHRKEVPTNLPEDDVDDSAYL